jgi:hypothetical protein
MQQGVDLVAAQFPEQEMALEYLPFFRVCRADHDSPRQGATMSRTGMFVTSFSPSNNRAGSAVASTRHS